MSSLMTDDKEGYGHWTISQVIKIMKEFQTHRIKNMESSDKNYVVSSVREALVLGGHTVIDLFGFLCPSYLSF